MAASQTIDLNADLGEGGAYDAALFPLISSANIACGGHAGDAATMRQSVRLALEHGVTIGAHPSLDDRAGFGRTWIAVDGDTLRSQIYAQVTTLQRICQDEGTTIAYVKCHGALYNRAAIDEAVATTVARAIEAVDSSLHIFAPPGSVMEQVATRQGLPVVREAFADRAYHADGTLVSRTEDGAVLHNADAIAARMIALVTTSTVETWYGALLALSADTICIHSDTPGAAEIAMVLGDRLRHAGIAVRSSLGA